MPDNRSVLRLIAGAALFAAFIFALLSAPGLLSDQDSTVPARTPSQEAQQ